MFLSTATLMKMSNMPQIAVECAIQSGAKRGGTGNKYEQLVPSCFWLCPYVFTA